MRCKLYIILGSVLFAIILIIISLYFIIKINEKYDTPEKSFLNSAPNNSSLIKIIDEDNASILVYKSKNGEYLCDTIYKTDDGWSSIKLSRIDSTRCSLSKYKNDTTSYIDVMYTNNKYFITVCYQSYKYKTYYNSATITDSINSDFKAFSVFDSYEERNGIIIFYLVLDEIPNDYYILSDGKMINIDLET